MTLSSFVLFLGRGVSKAKLCASLEENVLNALLQSAKLQWCKIKVRIINIRIISPKQVCKNEP